MPNSEAKHTLCCPDGQVILKSRGLSYQPLLEGAPGEELHRSMSSSRQAAFTRQNKSVSSAEKASDSRAGWEHLLCTAAMIVPTANSPSTREIRLPEVACLSFYLEERRSLGDLVFSLSVTFCLALKKKKTKKLLPWNSRAGTAQCSWPGNLFSWV